MGQPINVHTSESLQMGYGASSEMMQQARLYDQLNNRKQDILENDQMAQIEKEKKIEPLEQKLEDVNDKLGELDEEKEEAEKEDYLKNKVENLKSAFDEQTAKAMIKMEMLMNSQVTTSVEQGNSEENIDSAKMLAELEETVTEEWDTTTD